MIRVVPICIIAAMSAGLSVEAQATTRFALVVGHNRGDDREMPLRWGEEDAWRVWQAFTEIGDVEADRAQLLLSPSIQQVDDALSRLRGRIEEARHRGERTLLLFYYSGHGDSTQLHLAHELLPIKGLRRDLQATGATTVLAIVDACRNDRTPRAREKGAIRAPSFAWPQAEEPTPAGFVYLASAADGEVAQESDDIQGSLFTHHLVSGLRGSADRDTDGTVTLAELYAHGYSGTLRDSHARGQAVQHSEMEMALVGQGALVLTYPRRGAVLEMGSDIKGHILIVDDASGRVVAEVHRDAGAHTALALPPGTYRFQVRQGGEVRVGLIELTNGQQRAVHLSSLVVQERYTALQKGASLDPFPTVVGASLAMASSSVDGFPAGGGMRMFALRRMSEQLRIGTVLDLVHRSGGNSLWRYDLYELAATAQLAWVMRWRALGIGPTLGLGGQLIAQQGARRDAERLRATLDVPTTSRRTGVGVRWSVGAVAELELTARFGVLADFEATGTLLRVDGTLAHGVSWLTALGAVMRL